MKVTAKQYERHLPRVARENPCASDTVLADIMATVVGVRPHQSSVTQRRKLLGILNANKRCKEHVKNTAMRIAATNPKATANDVWVELKKQGLPYKPHLNMLIAAGLATKPSESYWKQLLIAVEDLYDRKYLYIDNNADIVNMLSKRPEFAGRITLEDVDAAMTEIYDEEFEEDDDYVEAI